MLSFSLHSEVFRGNCTSIAAGVGDTTRARKWMEYFLDEQQTGGIVMSPSINFLLYDPIRFIDSMP